MMTLAGAMRHNDRAHMNDATWPTIFLIFPASPLPSFLEVVAVLEQNAAYWLKRIMMLPMFHYIYEVKTLCEVTPLDFVISIQHVLFMLYF